MNSQFIYRRQGLIFGLLITFTTKYIISIEFLPNDTICEYDDVNEFMQDCVQYGLGKDILQQLDTYFTSNKFVFDLPLHIVGTEFQQKVWHEIALIQSGNTSSYKELAWQLNSSPRAVANACGANRFALIIPCHRVIASNKALGGFMRGNLASALEIKQWLLAHEFANNLNIFTESSNE